MPFEGHTAVSSKRRYRDRWNNEVLRRSAKAHGRSQKVKAVFVTGGTRDQYVRDEAAADIRRCVRSQAPTTLRLAGQWKDDEPVHGQTRPHCMRAMLVSNENVENGFANGSTGRILHWGPEPEHMDPRKTTLRSNVQDLQVRFYLEEAYHSNKPHFLPEIDFLDITPKRESVPAARGKPLMLQLQVQPAYNLTNHKVQALTIRHQVDGCLEGIFAHGQVYIALRCTILYTRLPLSIYLCIYVDI